jgi:predicted negative regulator of RcsB-dependent stress response
LQADVAGVVVGELGVVGSARSRRTFLAGKKIKVRPREGQKSEEPGKALERAPQWFQDHWRWVVAAMAALVVVLTMVWAFAAYGQVRERRAQLHYAHLFEQYPNLAADNVETREKIVEQLQNISREFKGTKTALLAQMDLARTYVELGRFDEALRADEKNAQALAKDQALLALVRYRMALTHEALGQRELAIAQFETLAQRNLPGLQRQVLWHLGGLHRLQSDVAKAREYYRKALEVPGPQPPDATLQQAVDALEAPAQGKEPAGGHKSSE